MDDGQNEPQLEENQADLPALALDRFTKNLPWQNYQLSLPSADIFTTTLMYLTFVGYIYQFVFQKSSATTKYLVSTVAGFALMAYLFPTWDVAVIPAQALMAYLLMKVVRPESVGFVVFVFVYSFHVAFILYVYCRTTYWDQPVCYIIAPLMFQTQKLTWLAYNIHDGWRYSKKQKLIPKQERDMLPKMPPAHQILAYLYNFHQIIYGPAMPFKDYQNFVENPAIITYPELAPALRIEIVKRFTLGYAFLWISRFLMEVLPIESLYTSDFLLVTLSWKLMILWPIMFSYRCYFYYMWSFAETANLAVGLGYSGKDENGTVADATVIASRATERDVKRFFRDYGSLDEVIMKNGFAFIEFNSGRDAADAVKHLDGRELLGSRVLVQFARVSRSIAAADFFWYSTRLPDAY